MPTTSLPLPKAFLEALLDSPLGIAVLDRELRYVTVNSALARMNSSDPRAFIGQTVREVVPHLAAILEPALRRVLQTATAIHDLEVFGEGPDVGRVWSEHLLPLRDADGQVVGVIVTVEETTARQQAQEALLESVIHYRHSVDLNPQIPWTADPDGKILDFSQRWSDLTGLSRESLLGEGWLEVPHPDDVPQMILAWTHALQTGDPYDIESRIRRADGSYIWMHSRAYARRDERGRIVRWYGSTEDIHQRKVTEQALQESEQRQRHIAEVQQRLVSDLEASNARQAFAVRLGDTLRELEDAEAIQRSATRLVGEYLGASRVGYAQDTGDGETLMVTCDYAAPGVASVEGLHRYEDYGTVLLREFRAGRTVVRPDIANDPNLSATERETHALFGSGATLNVPLLNNNRLQAVFFVTHARSHPWTPEEVTLVAQAAERTWEALQRARAKAEVLAANEQFTRTVEDAPVPILLQAEDGEVLRVNRAWTALTGYTQGDLPTMDAWLTLAYGHGSDALRDRMQALFAGEVGIVDAEFEILTKAGDRRTWLLSASSPGHLIDGRRFAVAMATDITERKMSEEHLRRNAETFTHLVQTAPFGIYVIDADFRFAHMSAGALSSFASVSPLLGRDFTEVIYAIWTEPFASEVISRFRHTLQTGESYVAATTEQRGDIAAVESYDWRIDRVTLPDGRYGVVCYFHDVTVQRAVTLRLEEINEAQRRFVSDAAHELRAPLTSIHGNLSLLRLYPEVTNEERTEMLADAERETARLTRLIADLLAVARGDARTKIEPERLALNHLLERAWRGALVLSEHRRFELGVLEPLVLLGDPDGLQQLFLILLENAVKYSPTDGAVRLEASERDGWAEVRVHNDGAGISGDDLERVFERFYRTDLARSRTGDATGTGLGLTIARQIVERHGGRVWLESAEGLGTTAVVRLPRLASDGVY